MTVQELENPGSYLVIKSTIVNAYYCNTGWAYDPNRAMTYPDERALPAVITDWNGDRIEWCAGNYVQAQNNNTVAEVVVVHRFIHTV